MRSSHSKLTPYRIDEIRALEKEAGKTLLSYTDYDVLADDLSDEQLARLRELEEKTGTALIAVRKSSVRL
ncbi:hypothetical protein [Chlorobium phaeobacteroides]|jgi:hypothetical protein|uniref:Uncharacterized protein n=1 Tax=Chlorobium phaeobacteroides (strain DSM 266 / SMG 266 / 2430) TaxID=290317 RepID=A1BJX0_CHLPD|nr:hypothetical protein [Chlorobium phaeobacteroides]ABL66697.1 conserved hypothetical protein [Chlorobium phaeobacteroides DSM 266]MBV5319898.1 hypothetical protein [Chlorobium phaeobacteroides]